MYQKISFLCLSALIALVSGCKNYSFSVNDKTIYTPADIFKDYQIADAALADCVAQTILDLHITRAEDLTRLNCAHAGIKSLAGLDKFFALTDLNLSENQIQDINSLNQLGRLEILLLQKNKISQSAPLLNLLHLRQVNLSNNPIKDCNNLQQLQVNLRDNKTTFTLDNVCKI
jgi:Leucine-rich repeat (LRR) protein